VFGIPQWQGDVHPVIWHSESQSFSRDLAQELWAKVVQLRATTAASQQKATGIILTLSLLILRKSPWESEVANNREEACVPQQEKASGTKTAGMQPPKQTSDILHHSCWQTS